MIEDLDVQLTDHATTRCNQRGVKQGVVELLLKFADVEVPARHGCIQVQLSRTAISVLLVEGISVSDADAAKKAALILSPDGRVITVLKLGRNDRRILRKPRGAGRTMKRHSR